MVETSYAENMAPTRTKKNLKNPLFVQIQEEKHVSRNTEPTANETSLCYRMWRSRWRSSL